ncbi:MAG TPA: hypothetical protein VE175_10330 [Woeseiaceae bacterium]|nr:hypothetical protein [Woeseiaceae bacterium]
MSRADIQPAIFGETPDHERLSSWKEIAAYLKREVRTVQRWEKEEGLPVHRLQHKKQGTVYAYRAELEAWLTKRRQRDDAKVMKAGHRLGARWLNVLVATAVLAVMAVATYASWRVLRPPPRKAILVVLPFENLSGDPGEDYFSEGLTEEMITQVGSLQPEQLGVIAWTTAWQYREMNKTAKEVGQALGADYILEGSVRRGDDRLRITAQLIQVSDQANLWAQAFDEEPSDVLAVQRTVARAVARQVK